MVPSISTAPADASANALLPVTVILAFTGTFKLATQKTPTLGEPPSA